MNDVVLVHPEIGGNTGAIIRLAANLGFRLHLVEPFGFELTESRVQRAGLDYHELADVKIHADWSHAVRALAPNGRRLAFSARAAQQLSAVPIERSDALIFGCESAGLPAQVLGECELVRIPMMPGNRSINLANAVAIVAYESWRQCGFPGAATTGSTAPEPVESFVRRVAGKPGAAVPGQRTTSDHGSTEGTIS